MDKGLKKVIRHISITVLTAMGLCISIPAHGQFYTQGNDPASKKWFTVSTQNFKIIYPEGLDSLATEYGKALEKWRVPVGGSIGYKPGQQYRRTTPVILHPFNTTANGFVSWAPRRMELYTVMSAYESDAMSWVKNLAIHESRHVSQMQFGKAGVMNIGHYLVGEMFTGALSGIYPNTAFAEGDAVVAETALTNTGRGRQADFLEWYRLSFDQNDMRSWYKWRYGSQKHYTPNHYTIGYMTVAGMRYTFDAANFTERYFERLRKNPIRFNNFQKTIREYSHKNFTKSFTDIAETFKTIWDEEDKTRIQSTPISRITAPTKRYTVYRHNVITKDGEIIAVKNGMINVPNLVKVDMSGKESVIRPFSGSTSKLEYNPDNNTIYWSESIQDPRWDLAGHSIIKFMNLDTGKIQNLTEKGRLFNPVLSPDKTRIAVTEYPTEGGSAITLLDATTGKTLSRFFAPSGIQIEETAWTRDGLFASVITDQGYGVIQMNGNKWTTILEPTGVTITNLHNTEAGLAMTCDLTGVNEIYTLSSDGILNQITATRYGASDFAIKNGTLYFANLDTDGKGIVKTKLATVAENVAFIAHVYPIADRLSAQEKAIGTSDAFTEARFSEVKRYSKAANLIHVHSWAPLYFSYDDVKELSMEFSYDVVAPGATLLLQNDLGTLSGTVGYSYHPDEEDFHNWRSSAHLDLTYTGLYPVFELQANIGDRDAVQYGWRTVNSERSHVSSVSGISIPSPSFNGFIRTYIPLSFNSNGWYRGVVPEVKYTFTNDWFNTTRICYSLTETFNNNSFISLQDIIPGKNTIMHSLSSSIRAYIMRPTPASAIYPRFGIGVELGQRSRLSLGDIFNSNTYIYGYGYLPGAMPQHGIRWTALYQRQSLNGRFRENTVITSPRGFSGSALSRYLASSEPSQFKISVDYAIPVLPVDWTFLCPLFYIRNFELIPHVDITQLSCGSLVSAGSSFNVHLGNFLWLPYDTTFGLSFSANGGSAFSYVEKAINANLPKSKISVNFNIDF